MHGQPLNQNMPHDPLNMPTWEDNLNVFIQVSRDNQERNNQMLDYLKAFKKMVEI